MTHQAQTDHDQTFEPPPRPRWVIWLAIGVVVAVLLFLGLHLLTGGGRMNHGGNHSGMNMGMPNSLSASADT